MVKNDFQGGIKKAKTKKGITYENREIMKSPQREDDGEYFYGVLPPPAQRGR